ncbi:MAG: energy-coupled thiamine transporter ThiT [Bacillota bacterium]|nr:energy-coupled thiamine transporter ThiT [Bacillota bacterium]
MKESTTKKIVMAGLMIALSTVLSYVKVLEMPQGGSITAGSMVPIILFAIIYGLKDGFFAACAYGVLQFILGGIVLNPASIVLDYVLGFGMMGLAGIFHTPKKDLKRALGGAFVGGLMRFVMLVLAGVIVWGDYAPEGMNVWRYSLGYNATYMIPEIILTVVLVAIVYNKVFEAINK